MPNVFKSGTCKKIGNISFYVEGKETSKNVKGQ